MLTLLLAAAALASDTTHELQLLGGVSQLVRDDRQISSLPHRGASPTVNLGWSPRGPRAAHLLALSFTPTHTRSGPSWSYTRDGETRSSGPDGGALADLQYSYGRRIDGERWTLHLGGTFANHFSNTATDYAFNGMETYYGVMGLGPWAEARVRLGERHALEGQAWTPVVAWVARNPYAVHSGQHIYNTRSNNAPTTIVNYLGDGSLQTLDRVQSVHLRAGYALTLSPGIDLVARGRADALHLTQPEPLLEWQLGLDLGIRGRI